MPDRLAAVLAVVYLIFNEDYAGRGDLAAEALWLGRALAELMPDEPEVHGLVALMMMHDARREARFRGGDLVLLAEQDRSLWDLQQITEGRAVLARALALHGRDPHLIQAAIASLHLEEPHDWPQVAALYGELSRLTDCCGASAAPKKPAMPIAVPWPWPTTTRSAASWSVASPSSTRDRTKDARGERATCG